MNQNEMSTGENINLKSGRQNENWSNWNSSWDIIAQLVLRHLWRGCCMMRLPSRCKYLLSKVWWNQPEEAKEHIFQIIAWWNGFWVNIGLCKQCMDLVISWKLNFVLMNLKISWIFETMKHQHEEISISKIAAVVYLLWGLIFLSLVFCLFLQGVGSPSQKWEEKFTHPLILNIYICLFDINSLEIILLLWPFF